MRTSTEISKRPDKRPRGRPRSFITSDVLERVRAVFMAKGFAAASLDELAEAAGLNRPSLYAAFGDKEQLYIHALRFYGEKSVAGLDEILDGKGTIEHRLGRVFKAAIELYTRPPSSQGCMIVGTATVEAPSRPRIAVVALELLDRIEHSFERAFARAVTSGELGREPSPAARARMAGAALDTLAIRARIGTKPAQLRTFAASMIPAICR
jgi:TetR/AcrR family transcriptional regulator, copper-responsive repressor